ncbi:hypothetical protein F0562_004940 [Nyssa sinensis]|uniref:Uncharacterized protein n=1 Tax=Nyssa sinensis TaxID=561372 RepID=A0A5J5AMD5_9ASTE|nr:hypothetical protein F0562_004940 [Nyssa sinensis]
MKENTPRFPRKDRFEASKRGSARKEHRWLVEENGDLIECSGKYCRSCTAGLIADCVALCCCPCAVVNFLALAFVKAPWMMGRKCLGLGKKKGRGLEKKRKCERIESDWVEDSDGNSRRERVEEGTLEIVTGFEDAEEKDNLSARFEAETVWLELYQLGHLGFGRVSFTGIQSQAVSGEQWVNERIRGLCVFNGG